MSVSEALGVIISGAELLSLYSPNRIFENERKESGPAKRLETEP